MKYLKLYEHYTDRFVKEREVSDESIFHEEDGIVGYVGMSGEPIIGYRRDIEIGEITTDNNYYTGTVYIGFGEDKGTTDYSSPHHTGQVTGEEMEEMVEEMDFYYNRKLNDTTIRRFLDVVVSRDYDGKIIKIILH